MLRRGADGAGCRAPPLRAMAENSKDRTGSLILILLSPVLLLVAGIWLVFLTVSYPFIFLYERWLIYRFWRRHGRFGRFVLFVYSDSPNWKDYIEANILPRIKEEAVTLNWSQRREWERLSPFEAKIFHHWAGEKEFNPMAIILHPGGRVKEVRFWRAFRDFKHGKGQALKKAEGVLFAEVEKYRAGAG